MMMMLNDDDDYDNDDSHKIIIILTSILHKMSFSLCVKLKIRSMSHIDVPTAGSATNVNEIYLIHYLVVGGGTMYIA